MRLNLAESLLRRHFWPFSPSYWPSGCVRCSHTVASTYKKCETSASVGPISVLVTNKLELKPIDLNYALRRPLSLSSRSSTSVSIRGLSSKTGQQSDTESATDSDMLTDDEDLFHEPPKVRFGMLKVALVIALGTYAGAMFAMFGANFLEEFEIFVKEDDDGDDD